MSKSEIKVLLILRHPVYVIFLKAMYVIHRKNRHAFTGKKKEMA